MVAEACSTSQKRLEIRQLTDRLALVSSARKHWVFSTASQITPSNENQCSKHTTAPHHPTIDGLLFRPHPKLHAAPVGFLPLEKPNCDKAVKLLQLENMPLIRRPGRAHVYLRP